MLFKDIGPETIIEGLSNVVHMCRFQYISEKHMIIDGAHNPNGIKVLNENRYPKTS
jgi:folylpolyglutamate synthase/dihydropteroate synthase